MARIGFDSDGNNPYVYIETTSSTPHTSSAAIGMDSTQSQPLFVIATAPFANIVPISPTVPNISIDTSANGNMKFTPNGTGVIDVPYLGTTGGVVQAAATTGALSSSIGTNGQLLIGSTGVVPVWANLTSSGSTITITNGANTINLEAEAAIPTNFVTDSGTATPSGNSLTISGGAGIATSGSGHTVTVTATGLGTFVWSVVTGSFPISMVVNHGYFANGSASLATFTLPATANVGDTIRISGMSTFGWQLAQNSGQSVNIGSTSTTVGVGGSLASTAQFDAIEIVCCVANTTFNVVSSMGNITVV